MKVALLLVDAQMDFYARPSLQPDAETLIARTGALLTAFRRLRLPVLHAQIRVRRDGRDRMPHWKRQDLWACVDGSEGASAPEPLVPLANEAVHYKLGFDPFANPALATDLRALDIDTLVIAGLYLHGCVRSAVLSAYEMGLTVWVAVDAVGSTEVLHSEITREYLEGRAAEFLPVAALLRRLGAEPESDAPADLPIACIDNHWLTAELTRQVIHADPCDPRTRLAVIGCVEADHIAEASRAAQAAQARYAKTPLVERVQLLHRWSEQLQERADALVSMMVVDCAKPINDAKEEMGRALAHLDAAARIAQREPEVIAPGIQVRMQPRGCVGLITPWNNPVAIALGKLAPALMFTNSVVWKPAIPATRCSMLIMEALIAAGAPPGLVNLVCGDAATARVLMLDAAVDVISITGSVSTGRTAAAICALGDKPLQAELGGNNACVVLADADIDAEVAGLARAAFSFSGQRCTAIRRFVVERSIQAKFSAALVAAVEALRIGPPSDPQTEIGPLISASQKARMTTIVSQAIEAGARLLCGGQAPEQWATGNYFQPTLIECDNPAAAVVQQESFGPIAVIQPADDLDDAIALANGVPHGLLASLVSADPAAHQQFGDAVAAGIVKLTPGPLAVHPDAPFGGWKASAIGPPEHGLWDREFYARPQVIYRP